MKNMFSIFCIIIIASFSFSCERRKNVKNEIVEEIIPWDTGFNNSWIGNYKSVGEEDYVVSFELNEDGAFKFVYGERLMTIYSGKYNNGFSKGETISSLNYNITNINILNFNEFECNISVDWILPSGRDRASYHLYKNGIIPLTEIEDYDEALVVFTDASLLANSLEMSIVANIKNNEIISYSIRFKGLSFTYYYFTISKDDFDNFRSNLEKAIEWDSIARSNNVEGFRRELPFSLSTNIAYKETRFPEATIKLDRKKDYSFQFNFVWRPSYIVSARTALEINARNYPDTFSYRDLLGISEIRNMYNNTTERNIRNGIDRERRRIQSETERKARETALFN